MKITAQTLRKKTINIANDSFTLYNKRKDGSFGGPIPVENVYAEWGRTVHDRDYGRGSDSKGLIILDGTKPFVTEPANGYFTITQDDKIVPFITSEPLAELVKKGEFLYTVKQVDFYTMRGFLLSVEVRLG